MVLIHSLQTQDTGGRIDGLHMYSLVTIQLHWNIVKLNFYDSLSSTWCVTMKVAFLFYQYGLMKKDDDLSPTQENANDAKVTKKSSGGPGTEDEGRISIIDISLLRHCIILSFIFVVTTRPVSVLKCVYYFVFVIREYIFLLLIAVVTTNKQAMMLTNTVLYAHRM